MKPIFYFLIATVFFTACNDSEQELQTTEYATAEINEEDNTVSNENESEDGTVETSWTQLIEANIGVYEKLAIMELNGQGLNSDGLILVTGYYFYVAHQKNLDLTGTKDPKTGKYVLTESYKGKQSGYMEFIAGNPDKSFWSAKKGDEKQKMYAKNLTNEIYNETSPVLKHGSYINKHEVIMMNGEENWTTSDELKVTFINDDYMAFDINVVGTNSHVGSVAGVAKVSEKKARYLVNEDDEFSFCDLSFDLSKGNEITVIENECSAWHGVYAYFNGTFVKK